MFFSICQRTFIRTLTLLKTENLATMREFDSGPTTRKLQAQGDAQHKGHKETTQRMVSNATRESATSTTPDVIPPPISFSQMQRIRPLGRGRNSTLLLGLWRGQQVARKPFDGSKAGPPYRYEDELAA
jgi:hypothetical protein